MLAWPRQKNVAKKSMTCFKIPFLINHLWPIFLSRFVSVTRTVISNWILDILLCIKAIAAYFYQFRNTKNMLNITIGNDMSKFKAATRTLCSKTIEQVKRSTVKTTAIWWSSLLWQLEVLKSNNNADISRFHLSRLCFNNILIIKLLQKFGFEDYRNIDFVQKVRK